jgi:hypothetical protein
MRWLTALAILCICVPPIAWGYEVVQFARARIAVIENPKGGTSLATWNGVPGLSGEALEDSLRDSAPARLSPTLREAQLTALIIAHPMSARAWLSLAGERLMLARPAIEIDPAVAMSRVTGPNEGSLLWQRGLLELVRWRMLRSFAQRQAATDLASAINEGLVNSEGITLAKAILVQQMPAVRAEIASELAIAGMSEAQLARIGLKADRS